MTKTELPLPRRVFYARITLGGHGISEFADRNGSTCELLRRSNGGYEIEFPDGFTMWASSDEVKEKHEH